MPAAPHAQSRRRLGLATVVTLERQVALYSGLLPVERIQAHAAAAVA